MTALKIYGPYARKDGRQHIILMHQGKRKTVSYPKYLLEQKLGRELTEDETCDHIDGDYTNNNPENLQVLSRKDNFLKFNSVNRKVEKVLCVCPLCQKSFFKALSVVKHNNLKQKKAGPFCSKACAGRYNQQQMRTFRGGNPNPRYADTTPE